MLPIADIFAALRTRWRLELFVFIAVMALVVLWTAVTPRIYVASASLMYDEPSADPVDGGQTSSEGINGLLSTQSDVIQSESVAADVVQKLQLVNPSVTAQWQAATGGVGDVNAWYGRQLRRGLTVTPVRGSRVLSLRYQSPDPGFAALMANGFAASYIDVRLKLQTDPARTYSRWFKERTQDVRQNLTQAQDRLNEFKQRTGIVDSGEADAEAARLGQLSSELTSAEAASADYSSRAGSAASQSPEVQASGVVQGLRAQIAAKSAQISQMSTALGPNHPDRIAAAAELGALQSKLSSEIGTATRSVRVASGAASSKEAQLRAKLNSQRGRILGLASERAQLDVLRGEVATAQSAYNAVTARLETMRLQSVQPETNVHQLDVAAPPLMPAQPNVAIRLLLGGLIGAMLAIGAAIGLESFRPRIRTARSVAGITSAPVLAALDFSGSRAGTLLIGSAR